MSPEAQDTHGLTVLEDFVDEAMLQAESTGVEAFQIADEALERRGHLEGVGGQDREQGLRLGP
jgi:hypothetical protein